MTQTTHNPTTLKEYPITMPANPQNAAFDRCIDFLVRMIEKYGYSLLLEDVTMTYPLP